MKMLKRMALASLAVAGIFAFVSCSEPVTADQTYQGSDGTTEVSDTIKLTIDNPDYNPDDADSEKTKEEEITLTFKSATESLVVYNNDDFAETAKAIFTYDTTDSDSNPIVYKVTVSGIFAKGSVKRNEDTKDIESFDVTESYEIVPAALTEKLQAAWVKDGKLSPSDVKFTTVLGTKEDAYDITIADDKVTGALGGTLILK